MKPKKKTSLAIKNGTKKLIAAKPIMLIDKTIVTTKQKTHTTIEDHSQIGQNRHSFKNQKPITPRDFCSRKMQQNNLSPFSSSGSQASVKCRKFSSPHFKNQKDHKKNKTKSSLNVDKVQEKKTQLIKRQVKGKQKMTREQINQTTYQNLLLRRLDEKKITQMSEQSSASIPKFSKLQLNIGNALQNKQRIKNNVSIVKDLKQKIHQKYKKQFPYLKKMELNFYCSIILIQRLWRQRKIKCLISQYISPRVTINQIASVDSHRDMNNSKLDVTATTHELTSQLIKKYNFLSTSSEKKPFFSKSNSLVTAQNSKQVLNLKDLQLSSELTPQKEIKMIKLVQCLRDISFFKPKKNEKKGRINVFNLQQSHSEKCLIQELYSQIFKQGNTKKNNFEIFSSKKQEKHLERSIELINNITTPQKPQIIQIQQRFQTQMQEIETKEFHPIERVSVSVQTEHHFVQNSDTKEIKTLKQLSLIAQGIIFDLLADFSEEFHNFTARSILKKKKQDKMPGIKVTSASIREYLTGLAEYLIQMYGNEAMRRFELMNAQNFLKIQREYDQQEMTQQQIEKKEKQCQELNLSVIPQETYYEYQVIYQQTIFKMTESQKKYSNFIAALIKIHNLVLQNCLIQSLQKIRINRIVYPWQQKFNTQRSTNRKKYSLNDLKADLSKIIDQICDFAFMKVGQFHRDLSEPQQQKKLLSSIRQEYKAQGNDWTTQCEYYQQRIEVANFIQQKLFQEIINDLNIFF